MLPKTKSGASRSSGVPSRGVRARRLAPTVPSALTSAARVQVAPMSTARIGWASVRGTVDGLVLVGLGEGPDDLVDFNPAEFVEALVSG